MAIQLSTTSSIVDYLGSQNKDSSFAARKKLYNEMGLNERLGDYVGSASQNTNFLNSLRTSNQPEVPTSPFVPGNSPLIQQPATNALNTAAQPIAQPAVGQAQISPQPPVQAPTGQQPVTATEALGAFNFQPAPPPTPEQVVARVEQMPQYGLAEETRIAEERQAIAKSETEKQALQLKAEQDTKEVKEVLTNKGLASSSFMIEGIKSIADNLATSTLGVDRELAEELLSLDRGAREKFLNLAADVIKGVEAENKTAIEQLNKAGMVYIDGQLLPTLEYRKMMEGSLHSVAGVGLVKVKPDGTTEVIVPSKAGADDLSYKQKVDLEVKLANDFEKYAKESRQAVRNIDIITTGYQEAVKAGFNGTSNNAPSQAVLVTFQKMLDPTSVVRESEYARSGDGQSLMARIEGTYEKLKYGGAGVTQAELQKFYEVSLELQKGYKAQQLNFAQRTQTQANNYNLNIENILTPDVINLLGGAEGGGSNNPLGI